jgi:hypothetical protein
VTPRRKGLHEIYIMRSGTEEIHGRSQDAVRLKTDLGWGHLGRISGSNRETESSVRGMTRLGLSGARGMTKWINAGTKWINARIKWTKWNVYMPVEII